MTELIKVDRSTNDERRRRVGRLLLFTLVGLVVVASFVGGRSLVAARDRSRVHVKAAPDYFSCDGTTLRSEPLVEPTDRQMLLAIAVDGMTCAYRFSVANHGIEPMRLDRLRFPILGPGAGPSGKATRLEPGGIEPLSVDPEAIEGFEDDPTDAVFNVNLDLAPGSTREFTLHLAFDPNGCTAEDGATWVHDTPILTLRSRGVTGTRTSPTPAFGFVGTELTNCSTR